MLLTKVHRLYRQQSVDNVLTSARLNATGLQWIGKLAGIDCEEDQEDQTDATTQHMPTNAGM